MPRDVPSASLRQATWGSSSSTARPVLRRGAAGVAGPRLRHLVRLAAIVPPHLVAEPGRRKACGARARGPGRAFRTKREAKTFLAQIEAYKSQGAYVVEVSGHTSFKPVSEVERWPPDGPAAAVARRGRPRTHPEMAAGRWWAGVHHHDGETAPSHTVPLPGLEACARARGSVGRQVEEFAQHGEAVREVAKRAGGGLKFHDLRHSYATWLVDDGVPVNMVQRVMGHERSATTLDLYTRRTDNGDRILRALTDEDGGAGGGDVD